MVGGRGVCLGPESVVRDADLFVAIDAREDRRAGVLEAQVTLASVVRLEWLEELFPAHVRLEREIRYDEPRRRVVSTNQLWYHDLLLREDVIPSTEPEVAGPHLAEALRARAPSFFRSNPNAAQWLSRVDLLKRSLPELSWPDFSDRRLCRVARERLPGKVAARGSRADRPRSLPAKPAHPRPEPRIASKRASDARRCRADDWHDSLTNRAPADPVRASSRAVRLDRDAAAGPRAGAGVAAPSRPEQPPRADHRRPEELLEHDLSPGAQGPSTQVSQTRLAGRPAPGTSGKAAQAAQMIAGKETAGCKLATAETSPSEPA